MTTLPYARRDTLPESAHYYRDTGCPASPKCLTCPLPVCIEDMPLAEQRAVRNADIRRMRRRGTSVAKIAARHGVELRTVYRVTSKQKARGD